MGYCIFSTGFKENYHWKCCFPVDIGQKGEPCWACAPAPRLEERGLRRCTSYAREAMGSDQCCWSHGAHVSAAASEGVDHEREVMSLIDSLEGKWL